MIYCDYCGIQIKEIKNGQKVYVLEFSKYFKIICENCWIEAKENETK